MEGSQSLEKRLIKNTDKAKQYSDTIKKDLELGHTTNLRTTGSTLTNYMTRTRSTEQLSDSTIKI